MKGKIFNSQEVQSILSGTKVMFREVLKPRIKVENYKLDDGSGIGMEILLEECPYKVGEEIFVKERFFEEIHPDSLRKNGKIHYDASCDYEVIKVDGDGFQIFYKDGTPASPWKSPVHMKQEHSRLTLEITDVKIERLKDISEDDAIKEGIPLSNEFKDRYYTPENNYAVPKIAFMRWWNATHEKPEEKFKANPFVWAIDFEVVK